MDNGRIIKELKELQENAKTVSKKINFKFYSNIQFCKFSLRVKW